MLSLRLQPGSQLLCAPLPCPHLQARPQEQASPGKPSGNIGAGSKRDVETRPMELQAVVSTRR